MSISSPSSDPASAVETFHLAFLRVLEGSKERSRWAVKGGFNLRAWFGSPRRSEDLDLDAVAWPAHGLAERVDAALRSKDLELLLRTRGLRILRATKPKQTETTQQWKTALEGVSTSVPLHTKIEFSHRRSSGEFFLEPVTAELARAHGIPAATVNHYGAADAARQKIVALGSRRVVQARDVFDLEHLFRFARADPRPLGREAAACIASALERALDMPFDAYRSQVVPYLAPDAQELHGSRTAWERMHESVVDRLSELAP